MSDSSLQQAVLLTVLLFLALAIAGWAFTARNPDAAEAVMRLFEKEVAGQVTGGAAPEIAGKIFVNNLQACLVLFVGGAAFGILTVFILGVNGFVIGAIIRLVLQEHSPAFVAAALLPHGIFEIPAFILAGALGLILAQALAGEYAGNGDAAAEGLRLSRLFLAVVLPLIAVAALVEAFITPHVIELVV